MRLRRPRMSRSSVSGCLSVARPRGTRWRSGRSPAVVTVRIENRSHLIYLLTEAAELEHSILCCYLFASVPSATRQAPPLSAASSGAARGGWPSRGGRAEVSRLPRAGDDGPAGAGQVPQAGPGPYHSRTSRAGVAQLVEHLLPKQRVAGSNPVSRSKLATYGEAPKRGLLHTLSPTICFRGRGFGGDDLHVVFVDRREVPPPRHFLTDSHQLAPSVRRAMVLSDFRARPRFHPSMRPESAGHRI